MRKIYPVNQLPDVLVLGAQTEHGVTELCFDCSVWLDIWPELELSIWVTPPAGDQYPAGAHMGGKILIWPVSAADTASVGKGRMEIMGVSEGKKKLSAIADTLITATSTDTSPNPPPAHEAWVEKVALDALAAKNAAGEAERFARAAEEAKETAIEAANAVGDVIGAKNEALNEISDQKEASVKAVQDQQAESVKAVQEQQGASVSAVDQAKSAAVKALQDESVNQQNAVAAKGKETVDSIPSDYTNLVGKVGQLSEEVGDFSNVVKSDYYTDRVEYSPITLTPLVGSATYCYWTNNKNNVLATAASDTVNYNGHEKISVSGGEEYQILNLRTGTENYLRAWFVVDAEYNVIASADRGTDSSYHNFDIIVPDGGKYLCINEFNVLKAALYKKNVDYVPIADFCVRGSNIVISDTSEYVSFDDLPLNKVVNIQSNVRLANRPDGYQYVGHNQDDVGTYDATVMTYTTGRDYGCSVVQTCVLYNDTYEFTKQPRTAVRYGLKKDIGIVWSDWSIMSNDGFLRSANRVVDVNSYERWTFADFNDAPANTIYQVDLNCADVIRNNPSPGHSGLLITYAFSPISRHALVQHHYALENSRLAMYIRYSYKNDVDDFRWTQWEKIKADAESTSPETAIDLTGYVKNMGRLADGSDLNSITGDCIYLVGDNAGNQNIPTEEAGFLTVKTVGSITLQTFETLNGTRYTRNAIGETWSLWYDNN